MDNSFIWLGTLNPDLNEERIKLVSLIVHGYEVTVAGQMMNYCYSWGAQQLKRMRKEFECKQNYQLFYRLAELGFKPLPLEQILGVTP